VKNSCQSGRVRSDKRHTGGGDEIKGGEKGTNTVSKKKESAILVGRKA